MTNSKLEHLIQDFSTDGLISFFREKSTKFAARKEALDEYNDDLFKGGEKLGEIKFDETEELIVCAFSCENSLSERSGKKAQYEKAKKVLRDRVSDAGIFVFYDATGCFRFSLVYVNYMGTKQVLSSFQRFTFFVSKELTNKTFLQQITDCNFNSLEAIKEAFSVSKVTNKFFEEFRLIFEKTKKEFEQTNKNTVCLWLKDKYSEEDYKEQINKFTFTFLGRIIFLYFLLRKGWIENQKDYIRKSVNQDNPGNLYLDIFEPLFFEVFATKENERRPEIKKAYPNTPYLNGGLFERSDLENEMSKNGTFIYFDNKFIQSIIIEFFEAYNFTVDENSPDDQEVSIDPEMLGKVFENTLAEEEREKKGTFYTPREVVHFMVKDALLQYLNNETSIDSKLLHDFIYVEDFDLDLFGKENIRLIDSKLDGIKVLDPAVGSAAFPVEMMQVLISLRKRLNVKVGVNINEVSLKKSLIKNNLYGVDIDPSAIEIAKLRLWLSLIVDYDISDVRTEPLPNLDFQFRVGNSLQEKIDEIDIFQEEKNGIKTLFDNESDFERVKDVMIGIKDKFYSPINESEKKKLKNKFDELEHQLIQAVLTKYKKLLFDQKESISYGNTANVTKVTLSKIEQIEQKIKDGTYKLFKPDFHFSEVFDRKDEYGKKIGGFDIVIGNPPYGVAIEDAIKNWHGLGSRDSYGVFISTAQKRFLKPGGVLSYIVSDTWLTIKTHKLLREQVLSKQLHKIVRLHQDCFEATVNACIICLTNSPDENKNLIAADLTNLSTRMKVEELRTILYNLEHHVGESTPRYGIYRYNQDLIKNSVNKPIFVASPKLFLQLNKNVLQDNDNEYPIVRLDEIAEIKYGIRTGQNSKFFFQNSQVRGNYRDIAYYKKQVLGENHLEKLTEEERLNGISPSKYGGRFIVPLNKGGESNTNENWLPKYYVESDYYFDWSEKSVALLKQIKGMRNPHIHFKKGITFSWTGEYAPTFRLSSLGIFDQSSSVILNIKNFTIFQLLGLLNSKLIKYQTKNYIDHSVNSDIDVISSIRIALNELGELTPIVQKIIVEQKKNSRYNFEDDEQEIDEIVYKAYRLSKDDITEIETWYARRYPKLVRN